MSNSTSTRSTDLRRRSALIGGAVVWATPIVHSISGPALAAAPSSARGGAPSFTLLVLSRGGDYLRVKVDQNGGLSCGRAADAGNGPAGESAVRQIDAQLAPTGVTWESLGASVACPAGLTTVVGAGGLQVQHDGFSVAAWSVHDGAEAGCGTVSFGPSNRGLPAYKPSLGVAASVFPKPKVTTCPM